MQRLIISHPEGFVWGENGGQLEALLDAADRLVDKSSSLAARAGREDFEELGYQAFIANLMPPPDDVTAAFRGFIEALYATRPVWGFKEVRYDLDFALRYRLYFPGVKVIFIVRDPRDSLSSIDEWETKGRWPRSATAELVNHWLRVAQSFQRETDLPVLRLRYEDYTADPKQTIADVASFTGLDPDGFDATVFDRRIHMHGRKGEGTRDLRPFDQLPADMRALLDDPEIVRVAAAYGYEL